MEQRTSDLNTANAQLKLEVAERTATEERFRSTQKGLIQAAKLAALGQMSAALSHEINQPLTAVKAYADNAATFLDRNRVSDARENVTRISKMADRMAALSGHLRNFARRPKDTVGLVDIFLVLDDAIEMMGQYACQICLNDAKTSLACLCNSSKRRQFVTSAPHRHFPARS
jgi:two-component system C4-dicarboxylate transport sensor histidine kinase DctB